MELTGVVRAGSRLDVTFYRDGPACKPNARWMGVNILAELDAPGEYYIDAVLLPSGRRHEQDRHPDLPARDIGCDATLADLEVCYGRHAGVNATGARGLVIERLDVHDHGTHGILLGDARDSVVRGTDVLGVGCVGIRATGGDAATLTRGDVTVTRSSVTAPAR